MPWFGLRLLTVDGRRFDVGRTVSWDDVQRLKGVVKGLGGRYEGGGLWVVGPYAVLAGSSGELRRVVEELGGKEVFEEYRKALEDEVRRYGKLGFLIIISPGYISDYDAYKIFRDLSRYADGGGRTYLFFRPESVNTLKSKYGPHLRIALDKLRSAGVVVIGLNGIKGGEGVIKAVESGDGEVVFDTSNPVAKDVVVKAVKEAVRELGGDKFSLTYNVRGIDDYGRPVLKSRRYPLARFLDNYGKVAVKAVLVPKVIEKLREAGFKVEGLPKREWGRVRAELKGVKLRPYQEEALRKWLENGKRGVVVIPTGGGKTIVALAAIAKLGLPTLIVVPTTDLVKQWRTKIAKLLGIPEEEVGEGRDIKPITVTTYQSLARHWRDYLGKFALVVTDETHHVPAQTFLRALSAIDAPYRLGLTATPERQDQNTHVITALTGKVVTRLTPVDLMREGYLAPVKVDYVEVTPTEDEERKYQELLREARNLHGSKRAAFMNKAKAVLATSKKKDEKIVDLVKDAVREGRRVIVFCEYLEQAKHLADRLKKELGAGEVAELNGKMSRKAREKSIERFKSTAKVLVVTPAGNEGLDIPSADTAVFASFKRSEISFIQRIGRVIRPLENKVSRVYVVYTPAERDYVNEFKGYVRKYIPQDEVDKVIEALARKAREHLRREAREHVGKEGKRVIKKTSLLGKQLPPYIRAILWKPVNALSKEDKIRLIEYVLSVKGQYALKQDMARESKRKARYVYTWLKDPSHSDIPGVDTKAGKKLLRTAKARLKKKRDWFAVVKH